LKRFVLVLGALLAAGCNFKAEVDEYCTETQSCTQTADGQYCVTQGHSCQEGQCCEGLVCGPGGQCQGGGTVSLSATELDFGNLSLDATERSHLTLDVLNEGPLPASGFRVRLGGRLFGTAPGVAGQPSASLFIPGEFTLDGSDCLERSPLAVGARCALRLSFGPVPHNGYLGRRETTLELENPAASQVLTVRLDGALGEKLSLRKVGGAQVLMRASEFGLEALPAGEYAGYYARGNSVTLEYSRLPDGVQFVGWSAPCNHAEVRCTVVMDGNVYLTATFSR
jgi:hypothetical protein